MEDTKNDNNMRVILKPATIRKIEKLAGKRLTTRCDKVINKALDAAVAASAIDVIHKAKK